MQPETILKLNINVAYYFVGFIIFHYNKPNGIKRTNISGINIET